MGNERKNQKSKVKTQSQVQRPKPEIKDVFEL